MFRWLDDYSYDDNGCVNCFNSFQTIRTLEFTLVSLFEREMLMYDKSYCKNIA